MQIKPSHSNSLLSGTLLVLSHFSSGVLADCCYTATPTFIQAYNFYLKIRSITDSTTAPQTLSLKFPADYQVTAGQNGSTAACPTYSSQMSCSANGQQSFLNLRLFTPTNINGNPTSQLSINGEQCTLMSWCPQFDDPSGAGKSNGNDGLINMGALGYWSPATLGIVITVLVVALLGLAYVAYRRNKVPKGPDAEAQMTQSQNRAGWFGETRPKLNIPFVNKPVGSSKSSRPRRSDKRDDKGSENRVEKTKSSAQRSTSSSTKKPRPSTAPEKQSTQSIAPKRSGATEDDAPLAIATRLKTVRRQKKADSDDSDEDEVIEEVVVKKASEKRPSTANPKRTSLPDGANTDEEEIDEDESSDDQKKVVSAKRLSARDSTEKKRPASKASSSSRAKRSSARRDQESQRAQCPRNHS